MQFILYTPSFTYTLILSVIQVITTHSPGLSCATSVMNVLRPIFHQELTIFEILTQLTGFFCPSLFISILTRRPKVNFYQLISKKVVLATQVWK